MNIYIACGLTHVPRNLFKEYTDFIHSLASSLESIGGNQVRYALINSDPQLAEKPFNERARLCYLWDREMVEHSDVIIAEASFPSTGLGIEMQIAEAKNIPIILCFQKLEANKAAPIGYDNPDQTHHTLQTGEGYVSLMALGIPSIFRAIGYLDTSDGISQITDTVRLLNRE